MGGKSSKSQKEKNEAKTNSGGRFRHEIQAKKKARKEKPVEGPADRLKKAETEIIALETRARTFIALDCHTDATAQKERIALGELITQKLLFLDAIETNGDTDLRLLRKGLVRRCFDMDRNVTATDADKDAPEVVGEQVSETTSTASAPANADSKST